MITLGKSKFYMDFPMATEASDGTSPVHDVTSTERGKARASVFEELLSREQIDVPLLRKYCFHGIPDGPSLRSLCWKILLGYLGGDRRQWPEYLAQQRQLYARFVNEMVVGSGTATDQSCEDHPLNMNPDSRWQSYFKDNDVLLQIDKDVRRLCPDISFFQQATQFPCKKIVDDPLVDSLRERVERTVLRSGAVQRSRTGLTNVALFKKITTEKYSALPSGQEAHWEVVERILFIYAKLNPGVGYVQGMNEILGPIYHTLATDADTTVREHAEADSFFCFTQLMSAMRDFFLNAMDNTVSGIGAMMDRFMSQVKTIDPELHQRLVQQEIKPQFYAFRWITLLLSQEFSLPEVVRLWDSIFAMNERLDFGFLLSTCCAMMILLREELLEGDFAHNMKLLQNIQHNEIDGVSVDDILNKALCLYDNAPVTKLADSAGQL